MPNWWEAGGASGAVAVYQPIGAASLVASYVDLSGNGNDAAPGSAPSWAVGTGWTFNGSSQYLDTGVAGAVGYTMVIRFAAYTGTFRTICGAMDAGFTNRFFLQPRYDSAYRSYSYIAGDAYVFGALTEGVMGFAASRCFLNGAFDRTTTSSGSVSSNSVYIGGRHDPGGLAAPGAGQVAAFALFDNQLSDDEMIAVQVAMAALDENSTPGGGSSRLARVLLAHAEMGQV